MAKSFANRRRTPCRKCEAGYPDAGQTNIAVFAHHVDLPRFTILAIDDGHGFLITDWHIQSLDKLKGFLSGYQFGWQETKPGLQGQP